MDLSTVKPETIIKPECYNSYIHFHQDIYNRLILVNTSIRIIDTVKGYPLDHLYGPNQGHFWFMVYWNFLYSTIVLFNGVINDNGKETLTIRRLKNQLQRKWLKDDNEIKDAFKAHLKQVKFSSEINDLTEQIRTMRDKVVAHRVYDTESERMLEIPGVSFLQLKKVYGAVESLFETCCFGVEHVMSFYYPIMKNSEPPAEDVQEILDLLVKNSSWLNQPECHGEFWPGIRKCKDPEDIEKMNQWRQKYNLSPA